MDNRSIWRIILIATVVLILAQVLNSVLSIASFEKVYRDSLIGQFQIIGSDLKRKIETAVNFGKPIEKFHGIKFILKHYMQKEENLSGISVTLPDGTILYSTDPDNVKKNIGLLPPPAFTQNPNIEIGAHYRFVKRQQAGYYYVTLPIYYENKKWVGNVSIYFDTNVIARQVNRMIGKSTSYLVALSCAALVVMALLIYAGHWIETKRGYPEGRRLSTRTKNFIYIGIVLIAALCANTYLNNSHFKKSYVDIVNANTATQAKLVKGEVDRILKMGVPIYRLKKMEVLLGDILKNVPECREIKILDSDRMEQFRATREKLASVYDPEFNGQKLFNVDNAISIELQDRDHVEGHAVFIINTDLIEQQTMELTIDSLTIIVVSLLFGFEILIFSFIITHRTGFIQYEMAQQENRRPSKIASFDIQRVKYTTLRSTAFIFFFAEYIPLAFLPLFIKDLYEKNPIALFGMSKQMVLGLPISAYMLGVTIFVLVAGALLERLSLLRAFMMFGLLLVVGSILSAFSRDVMQLTIFRFISGLGYGGVLVAGITLIIQNTDHSDRTTGFGYWLIGNSTATICAVPIGSVIVQYLGYRTGLLVSASFSVGLIVFVHYLVRRLHMSWMFDRNLPDTAEEVTVTGVTEPQPRFKVGDLFCVFKDLNVFAALVFASIPVQIAFIGFLHYAFPLYLDSVGISQANIGRFITVYGLAYIVCVPFVSKWSDRLGNERIFMILGNLIVGLVLISFTFASNVYLILVVIAVVGIGNAFVTATTGSYITLSQEAVKIGAPRLSSVFKTYQKLGTVGGPLLIGMLISMRGYVNAMTAIGAMIIFSLIFFVVLSRRLRGAEEQVHLAEQRQ